MIERNINMIEDGRRKNRIRHHMPLDLKLEILQELVLIKKSFSAIVPMVRASYGSRDRHYRRYQRFLLRIQREIDILTESFE